MADILNTFIETVKQAYGQRLKSIVLYGSKAGGDDAKKRSDYNLLIILDSVRFDDLGSLKPVMKQWVKQGNPPPLIFSEENFRNSADVFPIEFTDIKEKHKVLHGEDPLENLEIRQTHLRHQCEYELRSKLLKLRQSYMLSCARPKDVLGLMVSSISSVMVLFRHALRLMDKAPSYDNADVLRIMAGAAGINETAFITVIDMKKGGKAAMKGDPDSLMKDYLEGIEKAAKTVDSIRGEKV